MPRRPPDGLPGRVLALALQVLGPEYRQSLSECLLRGTFPRDWKTALLRKEGRPADTPSAYRPICLHGEAGKLFGKIIAAHLVEVGAMEHVRLLQEMVVARGRVLLAVSLDITNAFNTLPWKEVVGALNYFQATHYLRAVIQNYLSNRWSECPGQGGITQRREMHRGDPQRSVLGPLNELPNCGVGRIRKLGLSVAAAKAKTI